MVIVIVTLSFEWTAFKWQIRRNRRKKTSKRNIIRATFIPIYPCKCLHLRKNSVDSTINQMYSVFSIQYLLSYTYRYWTLNEERKTKDDYSVCLQPHYNNLRQKAMNTLFFHYVFIIQYPVWCHTISICVDSSIQVQIYNMVACECVYEYYERMRLLFVCFQGGVSKPHQSLFELLLLTFDIINWFKLNTTIRYIIKSRVIFYSIKSPSCMFRYFPTSIFSQGFKFFSHSAGEMYEMMLICHKW